MSQVVQSEVVKDFIKSKEDDFFKSKEDLIKDNLLVLKKHSSSVIDRLTPYFVSLLFFNFVYFINRSEAKINPLALLVMFNVVALIIGSMVDWLSRSEFKVTLLQVKKLLEPNHYETRIKYVSFFSSTVKIVVEANLDYGGLVIKESSKHFTSYLDTTDKVELVKNLVKIIEKQEKMFKTKE